MLILVVMTYEVYSAEHIRVNMHLCYVISVLFFEIAI